MLLLLLACSATDASNPKPGDSGAQDSAPHSTPPDEDSGETAETAETAETGDTAETAETGEADGSWRSALYPEDWTPGYAVGDHYLQDYSYAGYHNGEDALPTPEGPVFSVLDHGADNTGATDSCPAIQAAIDAAEAAGGGVVYLPAGEYRCEDLLTVEASGVVVQGDGSYETYLYFTRGDGMTDVQHLTFSGSVATEAEYPLSADARAFSTALQVADASGLSPGDDVSVGWVITDEFVEDHGMTGTWYSFNGEWRSFFRRTVVSVDTSSVPNPA